MEMMRQQTTTERDTTSGRSLHQQVAGIISLNWGFTMKRFEPAMLFYSIYEVPGQLTMFLQHTEMLKILNCKILNYKLLNYKRLNYK
jgi:hypothetical protein